MTHLALNDDALTVEISRLRGLVGLWESLIRERLDGIDLSPAERQEVVEQFYALSAAASDRLTQISSLMRASQRVYIEREVDR